MSNASPLPQLSAEEIRVLGSLLEKSRTTPELYPLSLVSLTTACNQKSARNPVVSYSQAGVSSTVDVLRRKDLLTRVLGDGRVPKFRHNLAVKYPLVPSELAVLTLLFLRGPLTVGEIRTLSSRIYDFEDLAEVAATLDKLSQTDPPYVQSIGRGAGQKEPRYAHLFAPVDFYMLSNNDHSESPSTLSGESSDSLKSRVAQLEARVASIEAALLSAGLWSPGEASNGLNLKDSDDNPTNKTDSDTTEDGVDNG
jgi:uncharacterized protein YceH (UPF0502 family)